MTNPAEPNAGFMAKRLRLAGTLIIAGLVVEGASLGWNHPLSFVAFIGVGGLLMAVGILIYLVALVTPARDRRDHA
ncbi:MAG TPA: hypothetical protein VKE93_17520 [Candidatus Angelobacter sp.]|nr:hypothetical protein [Candidatus Angelobacter sp.]